MLTANRKTEDCAFLALLIGVTALFLWMMLPFFDVIFWAATIGILFHPSTEPLPKNGEWDVSYRHS